MQSKANLAAADSAGGSGSGQRWSNKCDLCSSTRRIGGGFFRTGEEPECPWCKAVRMAHGSYWYPEPVYASREPPLPPLPFFKDKKQPTTEAG